MYTSMDDILFGAANESIDDDIDIALEGSSEYENTELTAEAEASIFFDTVMESCDSLEEFQAMVMEKAVDWQMYGLITDAEAAMEAVKKITIQDWKKVNMDRLVGRECIRLAKENKDPNYAPYAKARAVMKDKRAKLFVKWTTKAKSNVKAALMNSKNKASSMTSKSGDALKKKINEAYNKANKGKDPNKK